MDNDEFSMDVMTNLFIEYTLECAIEEGRDPSQDLLAALPQAKQALEQLNGMEGLMPPTMFDTLAPAIEYLEALIQSIETAKIEWDESAERIETEARQRDGIEK